MSREDHASVPVRTATRDDRLGVRRVLDAAMLDVREDLPERVAAGDVLVADAESVATGDDAPILGALVLVSDAEAGVHDLVPDGESGAHVPGSHAESSAHVDAVAVRRARRGQGVGTALVRAAAERHGRLTVEFDRGVRPFYESLGFEIAPVEGDGDRLRGVYESRSP